MWARCLATAHLLFPHTPTQGTLVAWASDASHPSASHPAASHPSASYPSVPSSPSSLVPSFLASSSSLPYSPPSSAQFLAGEGRRGGDRTGGSGGGHSPRLAYLEMRHTSHIIGLGRVLSESERLWSTFDGQTSLEQGGHTSPEQQSKSSFTWVRAEELEKDAGFVSGRCSKNAFAPFPCVTRQPSCTPTPASSSSFAVRPSTKVYKAHLTGHRLQVGAARFYHQQPRVGVLQQCAALVQILCGQGDGGCDKHPAIALYLGSSLLGANQLVVLTELFSEGSLRRLIVSLARQDRWSSSRPTLPLPHLHSSCSLLHDGESGDIWVEQATVVRLDTIRSYIAQLLAALTYMHHNLACAHRHMNASCVFLCDNGTRVKLGDIETSILMREDEADVDGNVAQRSTAVTPHPPASSTLQDMPTPHVPSTGGERQIQRGWQIVGCAGGGRGRSVRYGGINGDCCDRFVIGSPPPSWICPTAFSSGSVEIASA